MKTICVLNPEPLFNQNNTKMVRKATFLIHIIGKQTHYVNIENLFSKLAPFQLSQFKAEKTNIKDLFTSLPINIIVKYLSEMAKIDIHAESIEIANSNR